MLHSLRVKLFRDSYNLIPYRAMGVTGDTDIDTPADHCEFLSDSSASTLPSDNSFFHLIKFLDHPFLPDEQGARS